MDRFDAMRAFARVVEVGSFTRAAATLHMNKATVTQLVQQLEAHLRVKLLNRTTRKVSVTHDGAAYYERVARILNDVEEADASLASDRAQPRGRLRVDVPAAVGRLVLMPYMADFLARYPDLDLELGCSDRPVDLLGEGVDCAVRGGEVFDTSLIARPVGSIQFITCASPGYLARRGVPERPEAVAEHDVVTYFSPLTGRVRPFVFERDGERHEIVGRQRLSVNDTSAYMAAGLQGLGLMQMSDVVLGDMLADGRLVRVLADWRTPSLPIHVVYPPNRHLSTKVRVFADWVIEVYARAGPAVFPP